MKTNDTLDLQKTTQDLIYKLGETLDELEESDPKNATPLLTQASLHFLELKAMQRKLLDQIHESQKTLAQQRKRRDEQEIQLQNLKYQKLLNDHAIDTSRNPDISNLVQLCHSELADENAKELDEETVLQRYFHVDTKDPVQRAVIVDKLNQQITTRKKLEAELKRRQQQASNLKQSLASKRKLLQSLPSKLQEMERASLPLQNFCQKSLNASKLLGTARRTNLDLAYTLPKALYTLFYMLQSTLDTMETSGEMVTMETSSISPSLEVNKDSSRVILHIPIPTISDRVGVTNAHATGFGIGKKEVAIIFEYNSVSNTVLAHSTSDHDMGNLLVEVFPGDRGDFITLKSQESAIEEESEVTGRSYNWCNYLAGLHLAPSSQVSQPDMHKSATAVVRMLLRRVRAQATLSWILHAFSRLPHPLPVHPSLRSASFCHSKDSHVKLVSWTEESQSSTDESPIEFYLATLKRRSATLSLRVGIHSARYPSVPPTWEFQPDQHCGDNSLDYDKTALYDEQLSSLERRINQDVEQLVLSTDETTYEWILAHQLSEIATKWDDQQTEYEASLSS